MEEVSDVVIFFGRFHPLIVHLPIGFLVIGAVMYFLSLKEKFSALIPAVDLTLIMGGIGAIAACVLGYMLSIGGDYDSEGVFWHMWSGIALAVIPFVIVLLRKTRVSKIIVVGFFSVLMLLLISTGHLGGNLTHGATYLTQHAPDPLRKIVGLPPKAIKKSALEKTIDSVLVYEDIVMPILDKNCFGCHNSDKRKGELLMTDYQGLLEGGKSGPAINPGLAHESELIKRVSLPHEDKDFMPPDGKTPLNEKEVALIKWWIDTGAKNNVLLSKIDSSATKRNEIELYLGIGQYASIMNQFIKPVDPELIQKIAASGFDVKEIADKIHYLDVKVSNGKKINGANLSVLTEASDYIIWLDLKDSGITNEGMTEISRLKKLTRLRIDKNNITDEGLAQLMVLKNLEYLNLSYTSITDLGLRRVKDLPKLKNVYYWKSPASQ